MTALAVLHDEEVVRTDLKYGREIGPVCFGNEYMRIKRGLKQYYCSYSEVDRCFRRVETAPMKMCCGRGEMNVESMILLMGGRELQVSMPDTRCAVAAMEELAKRAPQIPIGKV